MLADVEDLTVPELPEVETVVRDLDPLLEDQRIIAVWVSKKRLRRPWAAAWTALLVGRRIQALTRLGKWIVLEVGDDWNLLIHLGMTGQLTVVPADEPRAVHTHLVFTLDNGGGELRFRDIRRFGCAIVVPKADLYGEVLRDLGPSPFAVKSGYWRERLAGTRRCLKAVLLDQRVVAGVGNIYADESLFEASLHPTRLACDLSSSEALRLRKAVATVLRRAIKHRGSSIQNYVGGSGLKGEYQNEFRVYSRTGQPCPRCKTAIECIRLAGRSTHYCPKCQPEELGSGARGQGSEKEISF